MTDTDSLASARDDLLAIPETRLTRAVLAWVAEHETPAVAHHSARGFLFARRLAAVDGIDDAEYDPELLVVAHLLHDAGLTAVGNRGQRFEVDGADVAAELLTEHGLSGGAVDAVWEAIALHTSPGIAERRGVLAYLVREGVGVDFGRRADILTAAEAAAIHEAHPRLEMVRSLVDAIVAQAHDRPQKAPRYSIAGELLRERTTCGVTAMETAAAAGPWGS